MKHVADPGPVNLAAVQRAAAQGEFLNSHIDCIVPWRFPPHIHIQRHFARLLRSWGEANVRHQKRESIPEIKEIHRGAMQPKGCAEVMRTEPSMSGSVVASGDAVRDASAMPLDVAAAPYSEGREHAGSAAAAPPACK